MSTQLMYKLLPDEAKLKVSREYATRRAVVILAAFSTVIVIGLVGLFPSFILSRAKKTELTGLLDTVSKTPSAKDGVDSAVWLESLNLKLQTLNPTLDNIRPSVLIQKAISKKTSGITITSILWSVEKDLAPLSISGVAADRQALLTFESSLNASGYFSDVALPVSNLAKDKNISFQMKLNPKNQ